MLQCSETGQLSSRGLFLSREAVHRTAVKPCCAAKMGLLLVDVRTADVMAGAAEAAAEQGARLDRRRTSDTRTAGPEYHV